MHPEDLCYFANFKGTSSLSYMYRVWPHNKDYKCYKMFRIYYFISHICGHNSDCECTYLQNR